MLVTTASPLTLLFLCFLCLHTPPAPVCAQSLSLLRAGIAPTSTPLPSLPRPLPSRFLPLCGNGRLDALADYTQQFVQKAGATFISEVGEMTLFAEEACDDGNRVDHDGCSADCMRQDLWSTPCALHVTGLPSQLEGPIVAIAPGQMLVSAVDGLYNVSSLPSPGDTALKATLAMRKSFAVSNLFATATGVLAYSAQEQKVYTVASNLSHVDTALNLANILHPSDRPAYRFPDGDLLLMHDNHTIVLVSLSTLINGGGLVGRCDMSSSFSLHRVVYGDLIDGNTLSLVDPVAGRVSVSVLSAAPRLQCTAIPRPWDIAEGNVWQDAFRSLLYVEGSYLFDGGVSSAPPGTMLLSMGGRTAPQTAAYRTLYLPAGLLSEEDARSPRRYVGSSVGSAASTWVGQPALLSAVRATSFDAVCASSGPSCFLDVPEEEEGELLFLRNATSAAPALGRALQDILDGLPSAFPSFQALYADRAAYGRVWSGWTDHVAPLSSAASGMGVAVHPVTGSLWLVNGRAGSLHEVSKSGVVVDAGGGRCMPSGVALCPPCMWAEAKGGRCTACADGPPPDPPVWAWHLQCESRACPSAFEIENTRVNLEPSLIRFSLLGERPLDLLAQAGFGLDDVAWSTNATAPVPLWFAEIRTKDPVECMRNLTLALAGQSVVLKPEVVLSPPVPVPLPMGVVIALSVFAGLLLLCIFVVIFCCGRKRRQEHIVLPTGGGPGAASKLSLLSFPRIVFRPVAMRKGV